MSEFTTTSVRRVAIVEDHGALRIFLRDVLQRYGWKVTGVAGTAETGCELVLSTDPDIAVVDLHLASEGGGDALIRRLGESASTTKVVVFTATTDPTELHGVLKAGADGIVLKEGGLPELLEGLDAVTRGEQYLSPSLACRYPPAAGVATAAASCIQRVMWWSRISKATTAVWPTLAPHDAALGPALGQPEGADHERVRAPAGAQQLRPARQPAVELLDVAPGSSAARRPRRCP